MMARLTLLVLLFPLFSFSQNVFSIEGIGGRLTDGEKIFLQYKTTHGMVNDSVIVVHNSFHFKGKIDGIVRAGVYRNQNPIYSEEIYDYAFVYLEKGNISITSKDTLLSAVVTGTRSNEDNMELRTLLKPFIDHGKLLADPFGLTPAQIEDTTFVANAKKQWYDYINSMIPIKMNFVNSHSSSFVSLFTLSEIVKDSKWLPEVQSSYAELSPMLQSSPMGRSLMKKIQLGKKVSVGMAAKDFSQPDQTGKTYKLSNFRGKYVLLDFWASWCGPCRAENPNLILAYNKYRVKGFTILSISIDGLKDRDAWLKSIIEDKMSWLQLSDLKGSKNEASKLYGITVIPSNFLISPDGIVIAKDLKGKELHSKLESLMH